jgi:hypothetical protein
MYNFNCILSVKDVTYTPAETCWTGELTLEAVADSISNCIIEITFFMGTFFLLLTSIIKVQTTKGRIGKQTENFHGVNNMIPGF